MSSPASSLNEPLSQKTFVLGLKLWIVVGMSVGFVIIFILGFIAIYLLLQNRRSRKSSDKIPVIQIPYVSKEIKEVGVEMMHFQDNVEYNSDKFALSKKMQQTKNNSSFSSFDNEYKDRSSISGEDSSRTSAHKVASHLITAPSPLVGLPDISQLGWGHWFTLRDLELATDQFSRENIIGEGGYGIVYRGHLINGTPVAIKKLLNNLGQAEKEFRVEVDAIGHVRHKNLVRLLGYCVEGTQRMLVYEYVNNGNLDQWLHGDIENQGCLTWEARMKIIKGTAKALAYLHEAIEPKVVHRDIKSGNILIDDEFDAKVSDFGLAKLLGAGKSHITTRVMGTFGYVAPEYANTGLLNEKSDVYSFGVVLLEVITGRDPVDYGRAADEVNLVDWLKMMIGNKRSEEVVDPNIERRPSTKALKRALLTALRCLDPDAGKRPRMSQVVRMLESDDLTHREDQRIRRSRSEEIKVESRENTNRRF